MQEGREELVAGRWSPSLDVAKMYNMLKDGKPHTVSAIAEVVKRRTRRISAAVSSRRSVVGVVSLGSMMW